MPKITLAHDYTLNGMVRWARNVPHEATDELRQLLADGVEGVEHEVADPEAPADEAAAQ